MGNFLTYTDVPIFANFTNENTDPITTGSANHVFIATESSLNLTTNLAANRYLGKSQISNDFSLTGPLEGKFSFTFYPLIESIDGAYTNIQKLNQLNFFKTTGHFVSGHTIQISNFLLKRCYLEGYSIKINPYQPISVSANFTSYDIDSIKGTQLSKYQGSAISISKNSSVPLFETLHALTTSINSTNTNIPITKTNIDIQVSSVRMPVYVLGRDKADSVLLTSVERTVNIQGENIGNVINLTGSNVSDLSISMKPLRTLNQTSAEDNLSFLKFDINGRIISQELSVAQNAMVNGKIVIKEIVL